MLVKLSKLSRYFIHNQYKYNSYIYIIYYNALVVAE